MVNPAFVVVRALHFAACLLLLSLWVFDRLILAPIARPPDSPLRAPWRRILRILVAILIPLLFITYLLWFALVTADMAGQPLHSVTAALLAKVWNQTAFGAVWKWRSRLFAFTALSLLFALRKSPHPAAIWTSLLASAALLATLVGTGHGLLGPAAHPLADILHLLAAACWPAGLLPFFLLLTTTRTLLPADRFLLHRALTFRFSTLSLVIVATLTLTGLINAWTLVGSLSALTSTPYGHWLLLKIILFVVMIALGAANLLHWLPRLRAASIPAPAASRWIYLNVALELALAAAIIAVIAVLGILPPPGTASPP